MPLPTVITGLGLVTPLGVGVEATWRAILDGKYVTDLGRVPVNRVQRVSRVGQLALIAAREAIHYRDMGGVALVVGTSKGPADEWLSDPTAAVGLSTLSDELARELSIAGSPRFTFSAACASGLHAVARAKMLLDRGEVDRVLVVAAESSLHPIWHGTFKRLGVLAPPGEPCRPFDEHRKGFVISEAAAAIILERREPMPGDLILEQAEIAADATHITGSDPDARAMRAMLHRIASDTPIDFVHAHATGTAVDAIELVAIRDVFGDAAVYSHKGAIGHTLGASGIVGMVLSARIHATGTLLPMETTLAPLRTIEPHPRRRKIDTSVGIASGFGGALAAVRLRRMQ